MDGIKQKYILRFQDQIEEGIFDAVTVEEPLEIQIRHPNLNQRRPQTISITMRTPGHDGDLAVGFLFTEGILQQTHQIKSIESAEDNVIVLTLQGEEEINIKSLERHFYTTSSCGVCGKTSIEAVRTQSRYDITTYRTQFKLDILHSLQPKLQRAQAMFEATGGIHAAALFNLNGELISIKEDVGRHNALDKLIGHSFVGNQLPLSAFGLLLSGRASFELIQKAAMAGICFITAVGAPSSLAIELANELGITLVGFLKETSLNVYTHHLRVIH